MNAEISQLIKQIEAVLFYVAEPVEISDLAKILEVKKENILYNLLTLICRDF